MDPLTNLERRLRDLEQLCDRDYRPLSGRIDTVSALVERIVDEIGGLSSGDSEHKPVRARLHALEGTEAGHRLVAEALKGRDHKLRDRLTLAFAGCAAFAAVHPWTWFG